MTEQSIQTYDDDEISLLDILVTLAESWKLLVFGPLIVGVLAGGLSFLRPKTFESVAILRLTEEEMALLHAAPVLDPLIEKFDFLQNADGNQDDARNRLKKELTFSTDKKTKLTTITAKATKPEQAELLGTVAIDALLAEFQIKGREKAFLEKAIAINELAVASADDATESIQLSLKKGTLADSAQESAIKNLALIYSDAAKRRLEIEEIKQKLELRGAEVFVQKPSLPQREAPRNQSLMVLLGVLASGFVLLVFVFSRSALRSVAKDQDSAAKLRLIKSYLRFRRDC